MNLEYWRLKKELYDAVMDGRATQAAADAALEVFDLEQDRGYPELLSGMGRVMLRWGKETVHFSPEGEMFR